MINLLHRSICSRSNVLCALTASFSMIEDVLCIASTHRSSRLAIKDQIGRVNSQLTEYD